MKNFILLLTVLPILGIAQDIKDIQNMMYAGNYVKASNILENAIKEEPENLDYCYYLGVCYLNLNVDRSMAVPLLEKVESDIKKYPNAKYLLGRGYHYAYDFDAAIKKFNEFKDLGVGSEENQADVATQIMYCENAKEYLKYPVNVDIINLGKNINSPFDDYFPFVPEDESFIYFNSRRGTSGTEKSNGKYHSAIYASNVKEGKFEKATVITDLNDRELDEEIVGLTSDGKTSIIYLTDATGDGDLYLSSKVGNTLTEPFKLDKTINSKHVEIAGCLDPSGNNFYFASNMPGGYGGTDLYVSRKLPNGKWSKAQNLGPTINTEYDEDFPNLSPDGSVLFFSSKGHSSIGGYDIFKAHFDIGKKTFSLIENMRFPINTPEDDMNFRISKDGRYGYISSNRAEGLGGLDIYRVVFVEVEPKYTVITGVLGPDQEFDPYDVMFSVIDKKTDEVYGDYQINPDSKRFVVILPPGDFDIHIEVPGYELYEEPIRVLDKSSYKTQIKKDIVLKK